MRKIIEQGDEEEEEGHEKIQYLPTWIDPKDEEEEEEEDEEDQIKETDEKNLKEQLISYLLKPKEEKLDSVVSKALRVGHSHQLEVHGQVTQPSKFFKAQLRRQLFTEIIESVDKERANILKTKAAHPHIQNGIGYLAPKEEEVEKLDKMINSILQ